MTLQRQIFVWLIAFLILVLILWLLSPILLPFIAGMVLAYFLDPVADTLQRWHLPRLVATFVILFLSLLFIFVISVLIVPILSDQIVKLVADLPAMVQMLQQRFNELAPTRLKEALANSGVNSQASFSSILSTTVNWGTTIASSLWSGGLVLVNVISLLIITPIVTFYILVDWDHMIAQVDSWLPREHVATIRQLFREINDVMAGFIRGQGTVCLLLGVFYAVALTLAGLRFGLVIGMGAGLLSFIPYVGALVGGLAAIGVAVAQFWNEPLSILIVIGIFVIGQFIEGNFLSPKLVGSSIGLHPVWLMFALFAFGYLFGFVGLLLAVPLAAASGVLVRFALQQYLASQLYKGHERRVPSTVKTKQTTVLVEQPRTLNQLEISPVKSTQTKAKQARVKQVKMKQVKVSPKK